MCSIICLVSWEPAHFFTVGLTLQCRKQDIKENRSAAVNVFWSQWFFAFVVGLIDSYILQKQNLFVNERTILTRSNFEKMNFRRKNLLTYWRLKFETTKGLALFSLLKTNWNNFFSFRAWMSHWYIDKKKRKEKKRNEI